MTYSIREDARKKIEDTFKAFGMKIKVESTIDGRLDVEYYLTLLEPIRVRDIKSFEEDLQE